MTFPDEGNNCRFEKTTLDSSYFCFHIVMISYYDFVIYNNTYIFVKSGKQENYLYFGRA